MSYHELNLEERIAIRLGLLKKLSLRAIARQLKRSPSTISREARRNSDADGNYTAYGAYQHTKARRVTCRPKRKLEPSNELFHHSQAAYRGVDRRNKPNAPCGT